MADNIEIKVMSKEDGDWKSLLECWMHFWREETVSSALPGLMTENGRKHLENLLEASYQELSAPYVVAWDKENKKVAGFSINQIKFRDNKLQQVKSLNKMADLKWEDISEQELQGWKDFWIACSEANLLEKYNAERAFNLLFLSVSKDYAKMVIASKLVEKSLDIAKEMGLTLAVGSFSSRFSQRIAERCGFEEMDSSRYQAIKNTLDNLLKCEKCKETKELRLLPCKHKLCLVCLYDIQRKRPAQCPYCSTVVNELPDSYPVCMIAKHFQKNQDSMMKFIETILERMCQSSIECDGSPVHICRQCMTTLCQDCSVGPCQSQNMKHKMAFLDEYADEVKQKLDVWTTKKGELVSTLASQRDKIVDNIKDFGQKLVSVQPDQAQEKATEIAGILQESAAELYQVKNKIAKSETTLSFVETLVENLSGTPLIAVYRELQYHEYGRKVTVGPYVPLHMGVECYDAILSSKGHLVVAKEGGVDIIDITDSEAPVVVKTLSMDGHAFSLARYKTTIIVGARHDTKKIRSDIITLDGDYCEVRRWTANIVACDFTIADDKILFSNQESPSLKMYTMMGNALPDIAWKGAAAGICGMSSASMAIADNKYNKVYRKVVREGRDEIIWSVDVIKPFALCMDADEYLWIRSNRNDCVTIVSPEGDNLQEILDEGFTKLGEWSGVLVNDNCIYVCHEDGVGRFELSYTME